MTFFDADESRGYDVSEVRRHAYLGSIFLAGMIVTIVPLTAPYAIGNILPTVWDPVAVAIVRAVNMKPTRL